MNRIFWRISVILLILGCLQIPQALAEINLKRLDAIEPVVQEAIQSKRVPGAVVLVVHQGKVVYKKAFGNRAVEPLMEPMTTDTIFDLASLTKPIATATSIFKLLEAGKLRLSDPVTMYFPDFGANGKDKVTLEHLLTHTSGLLADNSVADYQEGTEQAMQKICNLKLLAPPGEKFTYSDVGFIVLGEIVRKISGKGVDEFSRDEIYIPLGMKETGYNPPDSLKSRIAPTQKEKETMLRGTVHD
ncbi:MAG: Esterase EstB, partial [Planctomycetota bacterium]